MPLEVEILNHRKWIEGLLKLIIEFNQPTTKTSDKGHFDFIINDAYKKYYKSKVKINYNKSNITCEFDAKVKITGDGYWHLDWDVGKPFVSVQVKLVDGNINNIVNFKLLLPKSRASDNEIFITSLLRYLNFLAPRTFYTNAKINGVNKKYIFQEDLNKELLESNSLVEGPIIEGDERFTIEKKFKGKNFYPFSISRISNHKYIKGDLPKMNKSLEAITLMNKIYIQSHLSYPNSIEKLNINPQIENDLFSEDFNTYESLIYAMDADHGQSHDDRRFYYDPINNYFLPIYYDGKPGILNYKNNLEINKQVADSLYTDLVKKLITKGDELFASESLPFILDELKQSNISGRVMAEFDLDVLSISPDLDTKLADGDEIIIPVMTQQVYIYGEVSNTGTIRYKPNQTINDYLSKSGGLLRTADRNNVYVVHPNGEVNKLNASSFGFLNRSDDILIYPGSIIYVPRELKADINMTAAIWAPIVSSFATSITALSILDRN